MTDDPSLEHDKDPELVDGEPIEWSVLWPEGATVRSKVVARQKLHERCYPLSLQPNHDDDAA